MAPRSSPSGQFGAGTNYLALGFTFAAGVILFTVGGVFLDRWLGVTPLFTVIGALVGSTLSFLNVYWKLAAESEREKDGSE